MAPGVPETASLAQGRGFSDGGGNFDKLDEETHTVGKAVALKVANCEACFLLHFLQLKCSDTLRCVLIIQTQICGLYIHLIFIYDTNPSQHYY